MRLSRVKVSPIYFLVAFVFVLSGSEVLFSQDDLKEEESLDYYRKWLSEDVRYIIVDEEKAVFENLNTDEERERFIEQFWYRRDPDPRTTENEFKEEHYRRIAYANERFQSGIAGWKTDRGRIYIMHGRPDEVVSYPSGGRYERPFHEGGGSTSTFPFEVWRYRNIEGMDGEVELEFVDPTWAGQYHLTMNPDEKDALLRAPGAGLTRAEELGFAQKAERPFFQPGMRGRYPLTIQRSMDNPFIKYERFVQAQMAKPVKYQDLKQLVEVDVSFNELPFDVRLDYFGLDEEQDFVPVTIEVGNSELAFKAQDGVQRAHLAVYGIVTSISNRIVTEFDEDLVLVFGAQDFEKALKSRSTYQRILLLERGIRYRLDLVVKDLESGDTGVKRVGLAPPAFPSGSLSSSSLVLSDLIVPLTDVPNEDEMFVLGDVKVRPSVHNSFSVANPLGVYIQLYGLELDQSTSAPALETLYRIRQKGEVVVEVAGGSYEGMRLYGDQRVALIKVLPTEGLDPGKYQLEVEIKDLVSERTIRESGEFELVSAPRS